MSTDEPFPARFAGVTWDAIAAELVREHAARLNTYGERINKGRMTRDEADRQLKLVAAMQADLARFRQAWASPRPADLLALPIGHAFTWAERRAALLRELELRQRYYPQWIAAGSLDQARADRQTRALEAMLAFYENGLDWRPASGLAPPYWDRDGDDYRQARIEFNETFLDVALRQGQAAVADGYLRMIALDDPKRAGELAPRVHPEEQKEMAL